MKQAHVDSRTDIIIPGDTKHTISFCVEHLLDHYHQSLREKGAFSIALSGGSTPKAIFEKLTSADYATAIDWTKVFLFWSDERSVPPDHPDSNYSMAMQAGFNKVGIPEENIFRMVAERDIDNGAKEYERLMQSHLHGRGFDYIMLGLGEDGHTASLFPNTSVLSEHKHLVAACWIAEKKTWRMTLTYPCINCAKAIVIYVMGKGKREILKQVLKKEKHFLDHPAVHIGTKTHKALFIADEEASLLIQDLFSTK